MVNFLMKFLEKMDRLAKVLPPVPKPSPLSSDKDQLYQLATKINGEWNTDWGIQVGAYSKAKVAKLMIQLVHDHLNLDHWNIQ